MYFLSFFTSHNNFVTVMESLWIPISKIKCVLITPYRSGFNFCKGMCKIKWLYSWKRIQSNSKRPVKIWCGFFWFYIWSNCKLEMTLRFIWYILHVYIILYYILYIIYILYNIYNIYYILIHIYITYVYNNTSI